MVSPKESEQIMGLILKIDTCRSWNVCWGANIDLGLFIIHNLRVGWKE